MCACLCVCVLDLESELEILTQKERVPEGITSADAESLTP